LIPDCRVLVQFVDETSEIAEEFRILANTESNDCNPQSTHPAVEAVEQRSSGGNSLPQPTGALELDDAEHTARSEPDPLEPHSDGELIAFACEHSTAGLEESPATITSQQPSWTEATRSPRLSLQGSKLDLQQATLLQHFVDKISPFVRLALFDTRVLRTDIFAHSSTSVIDCGILQ
jgi:hypothetical protein